MVSEPKMMTTQLSFYNILSRLFTSSLDYKSLLYNKIQKYKHRKMILLFFFKLQFKLDFKYGVIVNRMIEIEKTFEFIHFHFLFHQAKFMHLLAGYD